VAPPATSPLVSRHVFIDTTEFRANHLAYDLDPFKSLIAQAEAGALSIYETTILLGEVKERIREAVAEAATAANKFRESADAIREVTLPEMTAFFKRLDKKKLENHFLNKLEDYRAAVTPTMVPLDPLELESLVADYFDRQAPFGEGKKKSEFPDAINIKALDRYCREKGIRMYVVSADEGFRSAAAVTATLLPLSSVAALLSGLAATHANLEPEVRQWFQAQRTSQIKPAIEQAFADHGFWIEEEDGAVDNIEATAVQIEDVDVLLVTDEEARFRLSATITFEADIEYKDPNDGIWDSEDKEYIWRPTRRRRVRSTEVVSVTIELRRDLPDETWEIDDLSLNDGKDIPISIDAATVELYDDGWSELYDDDR
jgi:hypothetical protein